jgi:hypothetical protein
MIDQWHVIMSRLTYIDLRIPKKIYTCAQSESACTNNIRNIYGN